MTSRPAMRTPGRGWLISAVLCILWWGIWGFLTKLAAERMAPDTIQVLFTIGLLPLTAVVLFQLRGKPDTDRKGVLYGLLNGVVTVLGLLAYDAAMARGKASVISPITGLFPLITVLLAAIVLRERLNRVQAVGVALALGSIMLLST